MKAFLAGFLALILTGAAQAAPSVTAPHATVQLAAATTSAAPGSTLRAAVILTPEKGWHTYWRNPGDAGEATQISWTLPPGWKAGDIVWPAPSRLPVGPIMNYGYDGRAVLVVPISIPASAQVGQRATLAASVEYLVCAQVCVPGTAKVSLALPVAAGAPAADPAAGPLIAAALAASPKPAGITARFARSGTHLTLAATGGPLVGASPSDVYFYPYLDTLIDQSKPQQAERGARGITLTMAAGSAFAGSPPASAAGVLAIDGAAYVVDAAPGPPPPGAGGLGRLGVRTGLGLPLALLFAFAGGLILNLMPCVFPILSMKAAGLARGGGAGARGEGLAFMAGVIGAFALLAGALIAAKAAGEAVGWGFQLQSPLNVALLCLVMLAAALNLSGLYEIGVTAQGLGSSLAVRGRWLGSALTGALAVIVAAPCTAPFMGSALGFALTQPPAWALAIFIVLAFGFALPYTALAASPGLTRRLPRPGPWMDGFKKLLAFPMYGAAAWLAWVLARQAGQQGLARLLAAGLVLAFGAWLFGVGQRRRMVSGGGRAATAGALICLALTIGLVSFGRLQPGQASSPASGAEALAAQPWSPQKLAALRAAGKPVLVNFTAAWCVTCQVNDRLALSRPEVAKALRRAGAVYLIADWTNRDPAIANALAEQGRIGVPLYLYYGPGSGAPKVLPQILTPAILVSTLAGSG